MVFPHCVITALVANYPTWSAVAIVRLLFISFVYFFENTGSI